MEVSKLTSTEWWSGYAPPKKTPEELSECGVLTHAVVVLTPPLGEVVSGFNGAQRRTVDHQGTDYEAQIAQAKHDLAHVNATLRLFTDVEKQRARYVVSHGFFKKGEIADLCTQQLSEVRERRARTTLGDAAHAEHGRRTPADARGLEVSRGCFLEDQLVQRQVRHRLAKPRILNLQLPSGASPGRA
jgi:hypothetical protein